MNRRPRLKSQLDMTSISGIDELPTIAQATFFFFAYGVLGFSIIPLNSVLDNVSKSVIGLERWRNLVIDSSLPIILGVFYLIAGVGHFVAMDGFTAIYPPKGTWGIWYLPGSASFHVAWTGVVESLGGLGLILGAGSKLLESKEEDEETNNDEKGLISFQNLSIPLSAMTLFILTLLVTPANIYMFTHGVTMDTNGPPLEMTYHLTRFGIQSVLLSLLITLAKDSFFYSWGDEIE